MEEKINLITQLIKMARVDKTVRDEEYIFLRMMAGLMQVTEEQLEALFEQYIEFSPPPAEFDRIVQFQRLVLLANIDLKVESSELELLHQAGDKLGLHYQAVQNVLNEMGDYERGMIPESRLMEIFKVYHN
jgi:hypothetical protein